MQINADALLLVDALLQSHLRANQEIQLASNFWERKPCFRPFRSDQRRVVTFWCVLHVLHILSAPINWVYGKQIGILDNTTASLGRSLLRTWLLRPSLSISVITARHDAVASFIRPENLVTAAAIHIHLKGIRNIPRILGAMRNGKAGIGEWQGLLKVGDFFKAEIFLLLYAVYLPFCNDSGRIEGASSSGRRRDR